MSLSSADKQVPSFKLGERDLDTSSIIDRVSAEGLAL